jgi:hypothetical protein
VTKTEQAVWTPRDSGRTVGPDRTHPAARQTARSQTVVPASSIVPCSTASCISCAQVVSGRWPLTNTVPAVNVICDSSRGYARVCSRESTTTPVASGVCSATAAPRVRPRLPRFPGGQDSFTMNSYSFMPLVRRPPAIAYPAIGAGTWSARS